MFLAGIRGIDSYSCGSSSRGCSVSTGTSEHSQRRLDGRRVALVGKLMSMPRRDVEQLVRDHGGVVGPHIAADTELVIVGDEMADLEKLADDPAVFDEAAREAWREGPLDAGRAAEVGARW